MTTDTAKQDQIQEIVDSTWPTRTLAGFALTWQTTSPEILAGTARSRPVWQGVVAHDHDAAGEFYRELAATDPDELRWCAAEALVEGGFTLHRINRRKS